MTPQPQLLLLTLASWLVLILAPPEALAQTAADVVAARAQLAREPSSAETVRTSLRYFRVDPEHFDHLRRASRRRGLLPILAAGYRYDDDRTARSAAQTITDPSETNEDTNIVGHGATIGAIWDLRELAFNPSEVQVYGLVGIQRDLILEVTRTYFLRRQLRLRLLLRPPTDPLAVATLELRIEEFTAILDSLTDGWFTEETVRRLERASSSTHRSNEAS